MTELVWKIGDQSLSPDAWRAVLNDPERWDTPWKAAIRDFLAEWWNDSAFVACKTSGSTGEPKLIRLSKKMMERSARNTATALSVSTPAQVLLCLPAGYIGGRMMLVRSLVNHWDLIAVEPTGSPLSGVNQKIDLLAMTPMQALQSLRQSDQALDLASTILLGGAGVSGELLQRIEHLSSAVYLSYGMTETASHVALRRLNGPQRTSHYTSVGTFVFSQDAEGCLIISDTTSGESYHTNDVVHLIDSTRFEWLSRKDDIINSGGIKLHPAQIEAELNELLSARFYVVGAEDALLGQRAVLVIEGAQPDHRETEQLLQAIRKKLSNHTAPREIRYLRAFESTASGKIKRILPER